VLQRGGNPVPLRCLANRGWVTREKKSTTLSIFFKNIGFKNTGDPHPRDHPWHGHRPISTTAGPDPCSVKVFLASEKNMEPGDYFALFEGYSHDLQISD